jgi:hypothetical protein
MADSAPQQNNKAVAFGKNVEREMPSESQSQARAMRAAEEGHSTLGIPKSVGKDFVRADHGRKIGKLPKHVKRKAKRLAKSGMISEKQLAKMEWK